MCLAHRSQLPEAGDFINLDLLGEPLIVVHGKDGVFRTLSRVCPHRAMDIMPPDYGLGPAEARPGGAGWRPYPRSSCARTMPGLSSWMAA